MDYKNQLFYYRDIDKKEIDLLYVKDQKIYPIEIKKESILTNRQRTLMS